MTFANIEPATLTPAQRAWQTRRLQAQARADIATLKVGVAEPTPVGDAAMVDLYVDDAAVGCGLRRFLVLTLGDKTVELFSAPKLLTLTVDRLTFDRKAKPVAFRKRTLTAIVERNIDEVAKLFPDKCLPRVEAGERALQVLGAVRQGKRVAA